jgi:hypothetical protein
MPHHSPGNFLSSTPARSSLPLIPRCPVSCALPLSNALLPAYAPVISRLRCDAFALSEPLLTRLVRKSRPSTFKSCKYSLSTIVGAFRADHGTFRTPIRLGNQGLPKGARAGFAPMVLSSPLDLSVTVHPPGLTLAVCMVIRCCLPICRKCNSRKSNS